MLNEKIMEKSDQITAKGEGRISVRNLNFFYADNQALFNNNLEIEPKKVTAIIGPSGCGKSTHLRVYNRIYELYRDQRAEGEVLLDGENILSALKNGNTILSSGPIINMGISMQSPDSIIDITIGQDSTLNYSNITNYNLVVDAISNSDFGNINEIKLFVGTEDSIYRYHLPVVNGIQIFNLETILNSIRFTSQALLEACITKLYF